MDEEDIRRLITTAIWKQQVDEFRRLLTQYPEQREGWFNQVAGTGAVEFAKILVELGVDVNEGDIGRNDRNTLGKAVRNKQHELVEFMLANGASPLHADGSSPALIDAVRNGDLHVVELLISAGANVDTIKNNGATPLRVARTRKLVEIEKALLDAGAQNPGRDVKKVSFQISEENATFSNLQEVLISAARSTFTSVREANPEEQFYAFAIYDSDCRGPTPSCNSIERLAEKCVVDSDDRFVDYKWNPSEWAYEAKHGEAFVEAREILRKIEKNATKDFSDKDYSDFLCKSILASVNALKRLRADGFFDDTVFLFYRMVDDARASWLKRWSAKVLNSPRQFELFLAEWEKSTFDQPDQEVPPKFANELVQGCE